MANNLINDVNVKLTEWQCSGDIDYLYHAIALIRARIEYEQMDEILGVDSKFDTFLHQPCLSFCRCEVFWFSIYCLMTSSGAPPTVDTK